jgi:DNA-binding winged helix-turn-helix (wHTH) protein/tetratricopeptide (TPR) repeat protein
MKSDRYRFDRFLLDLQRGVLLADGMECSLRPKSFALLRLLVENPGRLIGRDEIMQAVWPGVFVTDDSIAQCVRDIRRNLGDSEQRLLRTMKGRGYRFVAPVVTEPETIAAASPPPPSAPRVAVTLPWNDAEYRQVSAMSCELIGLSEPDSGADLEILREAVVTLQHCISEVAARHDGVIVNRQGNTLLILFGYPAAHEHNAEQAVRAGLELCATRPGVGGLIGCRIGVATGVVIMGTGVVDGELVPQDVVGNAPILAARLQLSAQPNTMLIDPVTRRLIGNLFDCRDPGMTTATGGGEPMPCWHVVSSRVGESRYEALRGPALSPLIGRDEEIDLLLRRWRRAKMGDGQVVLISGEPGIGKSRLTAELEQRLHTEPHMRLRYFCSPYHQDSALYPVADQFGRASGFAPHDPPAARLQKLEALLARTRTPDEDVALIADLVSLRIPERHPLPNLSPQRKKERTLEALIRQLEGLARRRPVLVAVEDAHWVDPTSRELLDLIVERIRNLPVLLIVTFRPEFQPVWTGQPQVTMLTLNRLDQRDRSVLVMRIANGRALPDEVVDQLIDRSDGVPLFIEELTKSFLESGAPQAGIPASLHDSLIARLDRLGPARQVAQIGAAIGRQFTYGLLHAVSDLPEDELRAALARLVASELATQRGTPPEAIYSFKHALVQDAAHGSLLRNTRQKFHTRIAEALATHFPELMDSQPELFAQHYAEAGLVEKAVAWWDKAGRRSAERLSLAEAATQFQKAIDQLALLPETPERRRQELEFHVALGTALRVVKGFAALETGRAFARARELWEQMDYPPEYFHVPVGQANYHALGGELDVALCLNKELLRVSRERNDPVVRFLAHTSFAQTLMFCGRFAASRSHFEEGLALHDPLARRLRIEWAARVGRAQAISHLSGHGNLGVVLFCLGYPDRALAEINGIIAEAQTLTHPPYVILTQVFSAILLSLLGDDAALDRRAEDLTTAAAEQAFPLYRAQGMIFRGWAKVRHGNLSEGMVLLRRGSSAYRATGSEVWMPQYRAFLAIASEMAGQTEEAAALLDDALLTVERTGERWFEAELNRYKGELRLRQRNYVLAEESFGLALRIAQEQQAKLWELRAAISLARLYRDNDRRAHARAVLVPVYRWFTEGFDTDDLKAATALLAELT